MFLLYIPVGSDNSEVSVNVNRVTQGLITRERVFQSWNALLSPHSQSRIAPWKNVHRQ